MKAYLIDKYGFYIEDYLIDNQEQELEKNIIITEMQEGLYKPKWDGSKWVEGATAEYIESIATLIEVEPTQQEVLNTQLLQQNAEIQIQLDQQKQLNAQILLQLAGGGMNV